MSKWLIYTIRFSHELHEEAWPKYAYLLVRTCYMLLATSSLSQGQFSSVRPFVARAQNAKGANKEIKDTSRCRLSEPELSVGGVSTTKNHEENARTKMRHLFKYGSENLRSKIVRKKLESTRCQLSND